MWISIAVKGVSDTNPRKDWLRSPWELLNDTVGNVEPRVSPNPLVAKSDSTSRNKAPIANVGVSNVIRTILSKGPPGNLPVSAFGELVAREETFANTPSPWTGEKTGLPGKKEYSLEIGPVVLSKSIVACVPTAAVQPTRSFSKTVSAEADVAMSEIVKTATQRVKLVSD